MRLARYSPRAPIRRRQPADRRCGRRDVRRSHRGPASRQRREHVLADTRSPVVTGEPSRSRRPAGRHPRRRGQGRYRRRPAQVLEHRLLAPSSPDSNSSLRSTSTMVPRSTTRATGSGSFENGAAVPGRRSHRFRGGDGEARRHARALVDRVGLARQPGEPADDEADIKISADRWASWRMTPTSASSSSG